jgi:hypothetical protein
MAHNIKESSLGLNPAFSSEKLLVKRLSRSTKDKRLGDLKLPLLVCGIGGATQPPAGTLQSGVSL